MSQLREMIVRHEGLRLKPYVDTVGKLTIGVGRNLTDRGISNDEANLMLDNDIASAKEDLVRALPWVGLLNETRMDALTDMCFNLGILRLLGFQRFLRALANQEWDQAVHEMLDSKWAAQVGHRAIELAEMIKNG